MKIENFTLKKYQSGCYTLTDSNGKPLDPKIMGSMTLNELESELFLIHKTVWRNIYQDLSGVQNIGAFNGASEEVAYQSREQNITTKLYLKSIELGPNMTLEEFNKKVETIPTTELIETANAIVSKLCRTGGDSFRMSVPPNVDDTDIVLSEVIRRLEIMHKNFILKENGLYP